MTPLVAFLLGIGLMLVTNGFLLWAACKWITDSKTLPHILVGFFEILSKKSAGIVVVDIDGDEHSVSWQALRDALVRMARSKEEFRPCDYL